MYSEVTEPTEVGGGVCLYVFTLFNSLIISTSLEFYTSLVEFILVENMKMLIVVVYRPQKVGFFSHLESALFKYLPLYSDNTVLGDFNSDFNSNSADKLYLSSLFNSLE